MPNEVAMQAAAPFDISALNPEQRRAVETVHGRVLILAGAGSGKTRVLTMRMAHLIWNLRVLPTGLLGLTFTNKAAAEMRHRLAGLIDAKAAKQVTLNTFHSFCMHVLRAHIHRLGYTANFTLYNEHEVERLIKGLARDELQHECDLPSLASTIQAIGHAKNRGIKPADVVDPKSPWHEGFVRNIYQRLQDSMRAHNALDFDSLLWLTVELFEKCPDVLELYQERFRYIMIDEYQDTNPIQFRLAQFLESRHHNLCVVGDDDQSIYGWRGADVQNILAFDNAVVIKLEQNYRSTSTILAAANSVIAHNSQRHDKKLWSDKGSGELIEVFFAPSEIDEATAVVARIVALKSQRGLAWKDIAILYRSNALSRQFEAALLKHTWKNGDRWIMGVPYQIVGGVEFYARQEVKDLLAYVRVIVNPKDQEALLRIVNQPRRGIGETTLDAMTGYNRQHAVHLWDVLKGVASHDSSIGEAVNARDFSAKAYKGINSFVSIMEEARGKFSHLPLSEAMTWLVKEIDYKKSIASEVKSDKMREFKSENVDEFISALAQYESQYSGEEQDGLQKLTQFISESALGVDAPHFDSKKPEDKVNLMTFHSAKGLEFPACFLVGVEDHIIPHAKSVLESGAEEERRLMYVAITRAMRHLTISMATKRMSMGQELKTKPSRFLSEIPSDLLKCTAWKR